MNEIAALVLLTFGTFRTVVPIERVSPPQIVLPAKRIAIVFRDDTGRAAPLRERIEALIREGDPQIRIVDGAPFIVRIHVRAFLGGNTKSIDASFSVESRGGRFLYDEGRASASNAGALINDSEATLIDDAARDVARIIVPTRHHSPVLLPKGIAEPGNWTAYLAAVERAPKDPYQQYALAVAHEAVGHQSTNLEEKLLHLRAAIANNVAAARALPSEKLFSEQYAPMHRAFSTPATPPKSWIDPHAMERWESVLLVDKWMSAPPAAGTLDNRGVLELEIAGRTEEEIRGAIAKADRVRFALDYEDMMALSKAGLSWQVIDAMRAKAGMPRREFRITPDAW